MKRLVVVLAGVLLLATPVSSWSQMFQTVEPHEAQLTQSGPGRLYCPHCGMNLIKFYKTSHALGDHQYCSLHCLVDAHEDLSGTQVVDVSSLKQVAAATAFYVLGSSVKGTMTMTSKYAFAHNEDAESFVAEHGGQVVNFAAAEARARDNLQTEKVMIGKKREGMAQKGQKIFEALCAPASLPEFKTIAEAKTHLAEHQPCGQLNDSQYQALAIYLTSRAAQTAQAKALVVPEKAKCPVCGMYASLYPNWAAEIRLNDEQVLFFDGVKDMMKFVFEPDRFLESVRADTIASMRVTDYYDLRGVQAQQAYFVIGSDVFGPMGNELIPFRSREQAQIFLTDHKGNAVVEYSDITLEMVQALDQ